MPGKRTSGHIVQDEGTSLAQAAFLDFAGDGVSAATASGKTTVTIPGATDPGAWTAFTPTLTAATTNPSGLQQQAGFYIQVGSIVIVQVEILYGGTPTVGSGELRMALPPVAPDANLDQNWLGAGLWYDSNVNFTKDIRGRLDVANTRLVMWTTGIANPTNANVFAANDQFHMSYIYEAA